MSCDYITYKPMTKEQFEELAASAGFDKMRNNWRGEPTLSDGENFVHNLHQLENGRWTFTRYGQNNLSDLVEAVDAISEFCLDEFEQLWEDMT